ncbi:(d)CMP kinase [Nakamurella flavida]|uniref:Cytidylate kinase n=1 Tax=Nakamurella flavida TaxID=363630 RepID=A0A938YLL2_9ACTN|nr:(d)CMP kinase [Nakamurella flavida]MBM9478252.1 (d)CMP kinase [Nakamurella flavida]MDP9777577.1 cytidylate kinase [Nakamurella flavida]
MSAAPTPAGTFVIAIDGPSGTGKSTVSRRVATELQAGYLDTGALYRIAALAVLRAGLDPQDTDAVADLITALRLDPPTDPDHQRHHLDGEDVSEQIRGPEVTLAVTPVSANPVVRQHLFTVQRTLAMSGRMVVEGRDIGTVIAPDATVKIYLTADAAERARRRFDQNAARAVHAGAPAGQAGPGLADVERDLARRDTMDSTRSHAPLQAAPDAVVLDSSSMQLRETVRAVLTLAAERGIS